MVEQEQGTQIQFLLSDFNTRLKDLEERNRTIRERVLLIGKNLISTREEINDELKILKNQTNQMQKELEKLKSLTQNIISEMNKFARKDEMLIIERMLKDFQPLEFARLKDVEALIKSSKQKNIKTSKPTK